jgi:hypothetical protein
MKHQSIARRCAAVTAAAALALGGSALLAPGTAQAAKVKAKKGSISATVPFDCTIFDSPFTYDAQIKLTGTRAPRAKSVALKATMSDFPGVSPVAIDNDVEVKLSLKLGSKAVALKGKGHAVAAAGETVPVPPVKGSLKSTLNSFATKATKMEFTIPDYQLTITCVPAGTGELGTLKLK